MPFSGSRGSLEGVAWTSTCQCFWDNLRWSWWGAGEDWIDCLKFGLSWKTYELLVTIPVTFEHPQGNFMSSSSTKARLPVLVNCKYEGR